MTVSGPAPVICIRPKLNNRAPTTINHLVRDIRVRRRDTA